MNIISAILFAFVTVVLAVGPAAVPLGSAGTFAILAKAAVLTDYGIWFLGGNVGLSPSASSFLTGFALTKIGTFATSTQVIGELLAADYTPPTPGKLTTAVSNMETAFVDAAGRVNPDFINISSGKIGGLTLSPSLYKWTTSVSIPSTLAISGTASDTWIFQISGGLSSAMGVRVILAGGALASNIVWAVSGAVTLGGDSHFEGVLLGATSATLITGATMNGRVLVQTAASLQKATVIQPS